jgi:hypothetical protein
MALGRVLVVGLDPVKIPGWDPEPVVAAITRGQARFGDHGIEADLCLVAPDENAEGAIVEALTRKDYACVVIGGGIRKHEPLLEFFEKVVNLVRQHAPGGGHRLQSQPRGHRRRRPALAAVGQQGTGSGPAITPLATAVGAATRSHGREARGVLICR